jgi:hypothetical protein
MMRMPTLPKLAAAANGPAPVPPTPAPAVAAEGNPFDGLGPEEWGALVEFVMQAMPGPSGPEDEEADAEGGAPPPGLGPKGPESGDDEPVDPDPAKTGAESTVDAGSLASMAASCHAEAANMVQKMEMLLDQAELVRDGKPKPIAKLISKAEQFVSDAETASESAAAAADADDLAGAATALQEADAARKEVFAMLEEAKGYAGTTPATVGMAPDDVPGAGKGPKGPGGRRPGLAVWAERVGR